MKKFFTIVYEVVGSRKTDTCDIWAKNVVEAINEFEKNDFGNGLKYSKYAILSIN